MKKIFFLLLGLALPFCTMAQHKILRPYLSTTTYSAPGETPFVENAMAFDCKTAVYQQFEPGKFRATVEISTIIKHEGAVAAYSKIALNSPVVSDTAALDGAFIDQQRFSLPNGEYEMEISVKDVNNPKGLAATEKSTVVIDFPKNMPAVSDILLYDSYAKAAKPSACTKSGLDFVPRIIGFYGAKDTKLNFYTELYNSNSLYTEGKYLVSYFIESCESTSKMSGFSFSKRYDVAEANVLMTSIDISELPTGNYYLVVEMRDRSNTLVASNSARFQKSNPGVGYDIADLNSVYIGNTFASAITNIDTLSQYIKYLDPVCSEAERNYIPTMLREGNLKTMQQFLYNFWSERTPMNPAEGWNDYLAAVKSVNASYTTTLFP